MSTLQYFILLCSAKTDASLFGAKPLHNSMIALNRFAPPPQLIPLRQLYYKILFQHRINPTLLKNDKSRPSAYALIRTAVFCTFRP